MVSTIKNQNWEGHQGRDQGSPEVWPTFLGGLGGHFWPPSWTAYLSKSGSRMAAQMIWAGGEVNLDSNESGRGEWHTCRRCEEPQQESKRVTAICCNNLSQTMFWIFLLMIICS
jgi:hypothetical protein